jgi:hypothetical protein
VGLDELLRLHEHPRGATAGVVHASLERLQHLDQQAHDGAWRVELTAFLTLGTGKLGEKVLVDASENVPGAALRVADADVADEVDKLAESLLVERRAGIVFW